MTNATHMSTDAFEAIKQTLQSHDVVVYMKGNPQAPLCGFSATVVSIFNQLKVPFKGVDILEDPILRQAIKDFSSWPTIPQVYIKGEFIGGCDIMREMRESGELETLLREKGLLA